jgi:diguanylate cyclase (GGDEF)-like protein
MQDNEKQDSANTDFLTGLYNRRYLKSRLEEDLASFAQQGKPYSLLMLDLDHFKIINDTFGHSVGDRVLLRTAGLIKANIRSADIAVRYAGDEFIVLLPGKDQRTALEVAKRFLEAAEQTRVILDDERTVEFAFSVGIATFPGDGKRAEDLLKAVDDALYIAKESGRGKLQAFARETPTRSREIKYSVLVGREKELAILKELVRAGAQGRGRLLLINGEAGIGKTRLASELMRMAGLSGFIVLSAKGDEFVSSNPAKVFLQPLTDLLDTKFRQELMALAEPYSNLLVQGEEKGFSYAEQQIRLAEGIKHIYRELSKRIPVFLFVDDLQWVDESSMGLLLQMSRLAQENNMLLCATYRSEEVEECRPLKHFVSNIHREGGYAEIALSDLGLYEVILLLTTVTRNPNESKKLSELLYQKIGGNPFYIEELLRDLVESQRLVWKEDRYCLADFGEIKLPKSVNSLLKRRLSRLDGDSLRVLQTGSVLGNDFRLNVLCGVLDRAEGELLWQLQKGQEAGLIDERSGGEEGWFCFHHPSIRELFYSGLGEKLTTHLHHSVAVTLEAMSDHNFDAQMKNAEEIAHHYLFANEPVQALPYLVLEAERLKKIFSFQQAIDVLKKAIEIDSQIRQVGGSQGLSPAKLAWVYSELGEIETIFGEYESGEAHLNQALDIMVDLEPSAQEFDIRVLLIRLWLYSSQLQKIPEMAAVNYELAKRLKDKARLARSLFTIGRAQYIPTRQYALAISFLSQALQVVEKERSPEFWEILSAANREMGNAYLLSGDPLSAVKYYLRGIYWAIKNGEPDLVACAYNDIVLYYEKTGELEKALKASRKATECAGVRKDVWLYSGISHQSGDVAMRIGRLDIAEGCYLNAWENSKKCPSDRRLASINYSIAKFYWSRGELEEALAWLNRLDAISEMDEQISKYYGKALRAGIMLDMGDTDSACNLYNECQGYDIDNPLITVYADIECGLARIDLRRGRAGAALQRLTKLKGKLDEQGEEFFPLWLALAQVSKSLGKEQDARGYLEQAIGKLLSAFSKIRTDLNRKSFLSLRRDVRDICEEYRVVNGCLPPELEASLAS